MDSTVTWKDGMAFDAEVEGMIFTIDAAEAHGGHNRGPTPKPLALTSLAGCTAMDVIAILSKMRIEPKGFSVRAETEFTDEHPKVFKAVTLKYTFEGPDLPEAKLRRAVELSQERYCGVAAMLRQATPIHAEIWLNGERLPEAVSG